MLMLWDGAADEVVDLSPQRTAIEIVRFKLSPFARSLSWGPTAKAFVHFVSEHHNGPHTQAVRITLSEGISWGLASGLFYFDFADPNQGAFKVTRLAERLHREGRLETWPLAHGFTRGDLHPRIADACWESLAMGKYDVAVFEAFRALEEAVVEADPKCRGRSGIDVFAIAFNEQSGGLSDPSLTHTSERKAWRDLFVGAYGAFRNPPAHRTGTKADASAVREELALASLLMRKLEQTVSQGRDPV